jgi:uncharacterized repeat protein (TIGR02543 family)
MSGTQYTITYNTLGGSEVSDTVGRDIVTLRETIPTLTGYTFVAWYTNFEMNGAAYQPGSNYRLIIDTTLYAQWTAVQYTLTYEPQGGSTVLPNTQNAGTVITLATTTFEGYTFNGWFTASSGGSLVTSPYTFNSNVTLYAQWTAVQYTLIYNTQGGSAVSSTTQNAGTVITLATTTYEGYTFNGWFAASSGGSAIPSPYTLNADVTLYAQWTAVQYTLIYNTQGGSDVPQDIQNVGTPATIANGPTPPLDWTFGEWNTESDGGGIRYNAGATYSLDVDLTLYAQWTATLNYNTQGGPILLPNTGPQGSSISLPAGPDRAGYTFLEWNTSADGLGASYAAGSAYVLYENSTIYAIWDENIQLFSLTYDSQRGSVVWPTIAAAGSTLRLADAPSRSGYTFLGWFSAPSGGSLVGNPLTLNDYVTLYAYWSEPSPVEEIAVSTSIRSCPPLRTESILFPRTRYLQRCCPSPTYIMTPPTVDSAGIVRFTSSYPMLDTDMYEFAMTNNQPANLLTTFEKYYKNSQYDYDSGVLAYPNTAFYITVTPYQDSIPRTSYTIPFTTLTPQPPLLVTATQSGISSAFLQWLVPESDQYVSTITSYIIRYGASMQTASSNSAVISGLASGTYTFTVQGSNMAGLGIVSTPVVLSM